MRTDKGPNIYGMILEFILWNFQQSLTVVFPTRQVIDWEWMNNHWFRFGASSLANDILMQLAKEASGVYQGGDYFSKD